MKEDSCFAFLTSVIPSIKDLEKRDEDPKSGASLGLRRSILGKGVVPLGTATLLLRREAEPRATAWLPVRYTGLPPEVSISFMS